MKKNLILVAAPPACGKTYVSELLAKALGQTVYLDKDTLAPLLRRAFALCGKDVDMDGDFYIENLRSAEYETILDLALSALRFEDTVILNAPFGKEVRDAMLMKELQKRTHALDARLILIWVSAPLDICFERIKARNSDRDQWKLENWEKYVQKTNYSAPISLMDCNAVDAFFVFDTTGEDTTNISLSEARKIIKSD